MFKKATESSQDLSSYRWTVDESVDLEVIKNIFEHFAPNIHFPWQDVVDLHEAQPELFELNSKLKRNEGAIMGKGQKLWERAKKVILEATCYFQNAQRCIYQITGQHIANLRGVAYGTWRVKNT